MIKTFIKSIQCILLFCCLWQSSASAQVNCPEFLWGKTNGNISQSSYSNAQRVLTDPDGNVFVTGSYKGTLMLDQFTATAPGNYTYVFVAKFNAEGQCQWLVSSAGQTSVIQSMELDTAGNIYILGSFSGTVEFGSESTISLNGAGVYVAKLNVQGECIWLKSVLNADVNPSGNSFSSFVFGSDEIGNLYLAGKFMGSVQFGTINLPDSGEEELFVAKLNADGEWDWANAEAIPETFVLNGLQINDQGVNLSGYFDGEVNFGNNNLISVGDDFFLAKMDLEGEWLSAIKIGGTGDEYGEVIVDEGGNLYIVGINYSSAGFGNVLLTSTGSNDSYIFKLDPMQNVIWYREITGSSFQNIYSAVLVDEQYLYVTGGMIGISVFGEDTLNSPDGEDIFIAKLSVDGKWCGFLQAFGTYQADYSQSIAVHDSANIYIAGSFSELIHFGDELAANNIQCFVAKSTMQTVGLDLGIAQYGATLHAQHANGSYQWIHCDGSAISGANQQQFTVPSNGDYAVIVTECGLSDTSACFSVYNLGLNENNDIDFQLFPNPVDHQLNIILESNMFPVSYTIIDISGKTCAENETSESIFSVDVQGLSPGIYILRIETANQPIIRYFTRK